MRHDITIVHDGISDSLYSANIYQIQEEQANGPTRWATDLDKYLDALAAAATTEILRWKSW